VRQHDDAKPTRDTLLTTYGTSTHFRGWKNESKRGLGSAQSKGVLSSMRCGGRLTHTTSPRRLKVKPALKTSALQNQQLAPSLAETQATRIKRRRPESNWCGGGALHRTIRQANGVLTMLHSQAASGVHRPRDGAWQLRNCSRGESRPICPLLRCTHPAGCCRRDRQR